MAAYHGPWIAAGTPPCLPLRGHLALRAPTSGRIHPPFFTPVIYALYDYVATTFPSFSKRSNRVSLSQSRLNAVPVTNLSPLLPTRLLQPTDKSIAKPLQIPRSIDAPSADLYHLALLSSSLREDTTMFPNFFHTILNRNLINFSQQQFVGMGLYISIDIFSLYRNIKPSNKRPITFTIGMRDVSFSFLLPRRNLEKIPPRFKF